jgi:hypothetical protein
VNECRQPWVRPPPPTRKPLTLLFTNVRETRILGAMWVGGDAIEAAPDSQIF